MTALAVTEMLLTEGPDWNPTVRRCLCVYFNVCKITLSLGIYGVGKAAQHPPALAVLSHTPSGATQTIAWVGKGIVYDTGGLSIKGKVNTVCLVH